MTQNLITAVPVLHVADIDQAEIFYCQKLGFTKLWEYKPNSPVSNPCYMGVQRDGALLHLSSFSGDGVFGIVIVLQVRDVDALFAEFSANNVEIDLEPIDQTWGNREMYLRDPDGNHLRFQQNIST